MKVRSDELRDMLEAANALDSPDLGPPPTASWEEDPVTNNSVLGSPTWPLMSVDAGSIQQNSVTNLETRRKRRESTHSSDTANYELSDIQASNFAVRSETDVQSFKVGAKRKLSVRDDGGGAGMEKVEERNKSFYGSSINQQHENEVDTACKAADNVAQNLSILNISQGPPSKSSEQVPKIKQTAHSSAIKPRKALGASELLYTSMYYSLTNRILESVNTDPLRSPTKLNRAVLNEKRVGQRSVTHGRSGEQSRQKERPSRGNRIESDDQEQCKAPGTVIDTVPSRLGSPAESSHDTFSPQSSEPLANLPDACDTPPPTDLVAGVSSTDALVATGRATRRARGSVSYVEPSLRDKMRRPTKELVDAVGSDDRPQIVKVQDIKAAPETEKNEIHAVTVKKEPFDEPADWRELPTANNRDNNQPSTEVQATSPHFKKNMAASTKLLPAAVITDRRGRDLSVSNGDQHREEGRPVSSSGPTIAALVAQAQRAKSHDTNHTHTEVRSSKDIFELDGSSPTAPTRTSRRHSSISVNGIPKIASAGAQSSANRSRERRRESIIGAPSCRSEDDAQVRSMKSNDQLKDVGMGRAERAASRRKSMML